MMMAPASPPLPAVLDEIADHAGRDAAMAIALAHGGQAWRVPARAESPKGRALEQLVGGDAAHALVEGCGGHVLEVPLARRAVVAWLGKQGLGASEIADRLRISQRTARRYLREARGGCSS